MAKSLAAWKQQVFGKPLDLDNGSRDCVDVSKHWVEYLTGVRWQESAGWGNAKDIYSYWSTKYLDKIPRGNAPKLGDIVVMNEQVGGGYGHTGVVVGIDGQNITIYQQNTFTQVPVYTGVFNAYVSYITGFLRPKVAFTVDDQPLQPYQRVAAYAAKYRDKPDDNGALLQTFVAGETYDFKGYVHGESVDGNDVWFVGRYTGGYAWSGAFTDTGTHGLQDLTPRKLEPHQRQVGNSVINYRREPHVWPDNVIKTFQPGEVLDFDAWTRGTAVDGVDVWFRGKYTGGWSHAGGFTNQTTDGLTEVTIKPTPVPTDPAEPSPTPSDPTHADHVIDISNHNKVLDYNLLKQSVEAVIAKAGHTGKSYGGIQPLNSDPTFGVHKANLGDKLIGAYWYGYPSLDAETEAKAFVETVGAVPANFTYWLDIEEFDGKSPDAVNAWARKFMQTIDLLTNKVCGLYCNRNWYNNTLTAETKSIRPIWLAHYDTPELSNPVANQVAHQFTSKGRVPGIEGDVDINAVSDAIFTPVVIKPTPAPVDPTTPVEPQPVPGSPVPPEWLLKYKAVAMRAGWTFLQAAGAYVAAGIVGVVDQNTAKALILGAIAAGFSAAKSVIKTPPESKATTPPVL